MLWIPRFDGGKKEKIKAIKIDLKKIVEMHENFWTAKSIKKNSLEKSQKRSRANKNNLRKVISLNN